MPRILSLIWEPINLLTSLATTLFRFWAGWPGRAAAMPPAQPVILYEFEGCPFCRIAREAVTALQLTAEIHPCPHGGKRYRPAVEQMGGKTQYPYMIDPNTGTRMYESADIVRYLYKTYGGRSAPLTLWLGPLNSMVSSLSMLPRLTAGRSARNRETPSPDGVELWAFEADPRARLVREVLCELEIPYALHTSPPDQGRWTIRLHDPVRQTKVEGAWAIRQYLLTHYA